MRETAHTEPPKTLVTKALKGRTAGQLVDRVLRCWTTHRYAAKFEAGRLDRPVGAAVAMLRHGECPDEGCEDGTVLESGEACVLCIERGKDHKADHATARKPAKEAADAAARRAARAVVCPSCEQDRGTEGAACPGFMSGMERDIAALAAAPRECNDARGPGARRGGGRAGGSPAGRGGTARRAGGSADRGTSCGPERAPDPPGGPRQ